MSQAAGILIGVAADAVLGDPRRHHPVAWFGSWAAWLERRLYADSIGRGALFTATALAPVAALGLAAQHATRHHPVAQALVTATATWAALGAHSLAAEGRAMADELEAADLPAARQRLTHLCSRDPSELDSAELARGTVESLAENTADAIVCSLFWGAVGGVPGLLVHRGINTLDAMVGYRNPHYERFGKASALLDDVIAYVPARLAGGLSCVLAPLVRGRVRDAWRVMRRDAARHPSPNGGWTEAAWAGALGVRLGGASNYHGRVEQRPVLGDEDAPGPDATTIRRAARLVGWVTVKSAGSAAVGMWLRGSLRSHLSQR